jgi:hypothetical protein
LIQLIVPLYFQNLHSFVYHIIKNLFYRVESIQQFLPRAWRILQPGVINLFRIDIEGPPHTNPDSTEVPCPHIHIYKEGYDDKWAYPLASEINTNTDDLVQVLIDFLEYNNIHNPPKVVTQMEVN